jgi:hypothetical protein
VFVCFFCIDIFFLLLNTVPCWLNNWQVEVSFTAVNHAQNGSGTQPVSTAESSPESEVAEHKFGSIFFA